MNLAHAASAHRGFAAAAAAAAAGVTGNGPLAAAAIHSASTYVGGAPTLHQRSPFAIQELLGLGSPSSSSQDSALNAMSRSLVGHGSDSVISVSTYMPRALQPGAIPGITSQAGCLTDPAASPHGFPGWRPNFMHAFPAGSPGQNVLQSLNAAAAANSHHVNAVHHGGMHHPHTDPSTGEKEKKYYKQI
ncbi:hypothetical protein CAPTEDRAFT_211683 [Capitella teleta]|uniref:Uncharacterized protein n=1 Tax=Capitella teleta TaxID=283909 RepID=R7UUP6_CAPTE|nr:hypothetical protein CAPTEDRAFT_211683 [Capitella teleta]|eukprot:ELU07642.1 hypothetical protein CAPTEDRAFT_211683 [Capitella teleta]